MNNNTLNQLKERIEDIAYIVGDGNCDKCDADDLRISKVNMNKDIKLNDEQKQFVKQLLVGTEPETVRNRFTGEAVELPPLAVALYGYLIGTEMMLRWLESPEEGYALLDEFYLARDIFIENWPDAYMTLLDKKGANE